MLELKAPRGPKAKFDDRWKKVTILHLLQHRGGWDRDKSFDPMFRSPTICEELKVEPPADPDAIIRYMLRQPLDFDPGERYAYSNFGYCLLGRVIEKVSGSGYEDYVKKEVLAPLGVKRMRLGKTLPDGPGAGRGQVLRPRRGRGGHGAAPRQARAVALRRPGAWSRWTRTAAGSRRPRTWCGSRRPSTIPKQCKILGREEHRRRCSPGRRARPARTRTASRRTSYYGCGWTVRPVGDGKANTWHNGSLDGTSTLLVRRWDGLTWAVLFNSRQAKGGEPAGLIDPLRARRRRRGEALAGRMNPAGSAVYPIGDS